MGYFNRLKDKWDVESNLQLVIIFVVFAITGSSSVKIAKPLLDFVGVEKSAFEGVILGDALYWFLRILIVFPIYQVLLIFFGTLFFQFNFSGILKRKFLVAWDLNVFFKNLKTN